MTYSYKCHKLNRKPVHKDAYVNQSRIYQDTVTEGFQHEVG